MSEEVTNNTESMPINDQLIKNWFEKSKSQNGSGQILKNAGNKFNFSQEGYSGNLHLYLGYDVETSALSVTEIYASDDTVTNLNCLSIDNLPSPKQSLEPCEPEMVNEHSIDFETAKKWIDNWMSDDIRDQYLQECFDGGNDNVVLAFGIDQIDFVPGSKHTGYLGLQDLGEDGFKVHVIILNEDLENGKVSLEDMTHSVPPWGVVGFGLFQRLGI